MRVEVLGAQLVDHLRRLRGRGTRRLLLAAPIGEHRLQVVDLGVEDGGFLQHLEIRRRFVVAAEIDEQTGPGEARGIQTRVEFDRPGVELERLVELVAGVRDGAHHADRFGIAGRHARRLCGKPVRLAEIAALHGKPCQPDQRRRVARAQRHGGGKGRLGIVEALEFQIGGAAQIVDRGGDIPAELRDIQFGEQFAVLALHEQRFAEQRNRETRIGAQTRRLTHHRLRRRAAALGEIHASEQDRRRQVVRRTLQGVLQLHDGAGIVVAREAGDRVLVKLGGGIGGTCARRCAHRQHDQHGHGEAREGSAHEPRVGWRSAVHGVGFIGDPLRC